MKGCMIYQEAGVFSFTLCFSGSYSDLVSLLLSLFTAKAGTGVLFFFFSNANGGVLFSGFPRREIHSHGERASRLDPPWNY